MKIYSVLSELILRRPPFENQKNVFPEQMIIEPTFEA